MGSGEFASRRGSPSGRRLAPAAAAVVALAGGGAALAPEGGGGDDEDDDTTSSAAAGWEWIVSGREWADGSEFAFWERRADPTEVVFYLDGGV